MVLSELHEELNKIAPTRYSHFNKKQELPFITYMDDGDDNFHADNIDYVGFSFVRIELYTKNKDFNLENRLKDLFRNKGIPFDKTSIDYIDQEETFMTIFEIKIRY